MVSTERDDDLMQLTVDIVHLVGSGQSGFSLTDPLDCHVYLLDGGSELALIDTGVGRDHGGGHRR